jgi:DNA-binding CsgD family transcriptional regulator
MFEVFGVRVETELAYRMLLRRPDLAVPVEASDLGVPAAAAGAVLDELVHAGLLVSGDTGLVVVPPELAVESLTARAEEQLEARRRAIHDAREGVSAAVADLVDSHRELAASVTEVVRTGDAVRARLHQLTHQATDHVWSINPGPALSARAVEASRVMDRTLHDHGVTQRAIVDDVALTDARFHKYLREAAARGDHIRSHPAPPAQLPLFDDVTAVVPLIEPDSNYGALIVHEPGLIAPLVALFEQSWAAAVPLGLSRPDNGSDPDGPRIRQVLTMLANGQSDAAIARHLGVSSRTIGRLVAEAGRRLQAGNRIEICMRAHRAGWIRDLPHDPGPAASPQ